MIIQDELHLISGPPGTPVGLYENALDCLSSWEVEGQRVQPKVIAATAVIRRAAEQVRQVSIFPPNGLDAAYNFFARQRPPGRDTPGRRYLGICAPGRRLKATLIRVYVAYLSAGQYLSERYGKAADPWMTLVGYINSMNELGEMRRLVEDDVRSRLGKMNRRGMAQRQAPYLEELTSRKSSTVIPRILDLLERTFQPAASERTDSSPRPRDLSRYEQFEHYHASFYQQVEALSVTPFAPRALDRGLVALLVSYVRLLGVEFNENSQAGRVTGDHPYVAAAIDELVQRATTITGNAETGSMVREALEELKDYWLTRVASMRVGAVLGYRWKSDGRTVGLLRLPGQSSWEPFTCPNSLRDVEPLVNLILDDCGLDSPAESAGT